MMLNKSKCFKWFKLVYNGSKWYKMVENGSNWLYKGSKWF